MSDEHWTKVEQGWRDNRTALVWLPKEPEMYTHEEAMKLENETKRLPTIGELRMAWESGAAKVMDDWAYWFWSSSVHPGNDDLAFAFLGRGGYIVSGDRSHYNGAVRCVARGVR